MDQTEFAATRAGLLIQAKAKRVIAVHVRALAAQIDNQIDRVGYIDDADRLEREAAQLEAKASQLPDDSLIG